MKQCTNCQWEGKEEELKTMTPDPCDYTQEYCPKCRRKEFIIDKIMEEQLVSFQTAKLAKEKGFGYWCQKRYSYREEKYGELENSPFKSVLVKPDTKQIFAPTQSILQKYLREEHKIEACVFPAYNSIIEKIYNEEEINNAEFLGDKDFAQYCGIMNNNSDDSIENGKDDYFCFGDTFEQCLEKVLYEALKLI